MLARYAAAAGLDSAGASPNKSFPREVGGRRGIRNLSKPPKLNLQNQPKNLLQESVPECRESGRSFRSGKPLRWFPCAVPEEYAAARACRSLGTAHRGLRPWPCRCGVWRCARKARANLPAPARLFLCVRRWRLRAVSFSPCLAPEFLFAPRRPPARLLSIETPRF